MAIADVLDLPLDVVASKKMRAPHNEELGVSDDYLREERERATEVAREKERRYSGDPIGEERVEDRHGTFASNREEFRCGPARI